MRIIHQLPGRMRLYLTEEERDGRTCGMIEYLARCIPEVVSANFNPVSQTLVIYHDETKKSSQIFEDLIDQFGLRWNLQKKKMLKAAEVLLTAIFYERHMKTSASPLWKAVMLSSSLWDNLRLNPQVFSSGGRHLLKGKPNADSLTLISVLASYITQQPVTGTTVMIMSGISDYIGELTSNKSKAFLQQSIKVHDQLVHVKKDEEISDIPLKEVQVGDTLCFYTGEKILIDGTITGGSAFIDEAGITGEFQAAKKIIGEKVYASTMIDSGQIEVQADKVGTQTEESAIYRLLAEAEDNKSETQKIADRLAKKMVVISFGAAGLTYFLKRDLMKMVGILVIDFVCGVKLSSEIAILTAMNHFTKKGIVVKGGQVIEKSAQVKEVVFDKTGTLTTGRPVISRILLAEDVAEAELLRAAGYAEQHANHPLTHAILNAAKEKELTYPNLTIEDEEVIPGFGIIAHNYQGKTVHVGSKKLMEKFAITGFPELPKDYNPKGNIIYVALGQKPLGIILVSDEIRENMEQTIEELKSLGVEKNTMLTGDKKAVAVKIADKLQLNRVKSELLPQEKVEYIKEAETSHPLMMVGDGLNDSAALKWSSVGVALGHKASDAAKSASDVLIQADQPEVISEIVATSQKTMRVIGQNYRLVFLFNTLAIALSFSGKINPMVSALIHNGTTIAVMIRSITKLR